MSPRHEVTPVVFIHGLWLHASSWEDWIKLFRRLGYDPVFAPDWPKEADSVAEARLLSEQVAGLGIAEITEHYAKIIGRMDKLPVVIGHSIGGLVAEKLLGGGMASAAIAIAPTQSKGVPSWPLRQLASSWPSLKNPFNRNRAVGLTAQEFRYTYGNALSREESTELYTRWAVPSPVRPLWQVIGASFTPRAASAVNVLTEDGGPLLLIAGGRDNMIPASLVRAQYAMYTKSPATTDFHEFTNRGHSMCIDNGWREVADLCVEWLKVRLHGTYDQS